MRAVSLVKSARKSASSFKLISANKTNFTKTTLLSILKVFLVMVNFKMLKVLGRVRVATSQHCQNCLEFFQNQEFHRKSGLVFQVTKISIEIFNDFTARKL